jgi:hypothetical protein
MLPANSTVDTIGSKSVLVKTTGHEKLRITAVGRKLTSFVILKRKISHKKNFLLKLYLHVIRKDG